MHFTYPGPSHRPMKLATLSILLGLIALVLAPAGRQGSAGGLTPPASAASACPADDRHLVPWLGGRWFLSGVNVPWQNGGFGADFGTVEAWGQHTYSSSETDQMFANLKAKGANSVRWWVFADGRGAPEYSNGTVSGFDAKTLPAMADAIKLAQKHGIYLTFTLWSFDMLYTTNAVGGKQQALFTDAAKRKAYIDNAIIPMLKYAVPGTSYSIGTHPNVLSWEIINEPEWGIKEAGSVNGNIGQPVSLAQMQRFIAETTGAIHRNSNQLVTVGSASMKWNSTGAPGAVGNWYSDAALRQYDADGALDYYQIHYYSWMNGDASWSASPLKVSWQQGAFDKPVVVGEFSANAGGTGTTTTQLFETLFGNCYAGAWGWSYEGVDGEGSWADMAGPLATFGAAHSADLNIGGAAPPPPATATPQPTAAQPTATAVQPTATAVQPTATAVQPTATATPPASGAAKVIYADTLSAGWSSWSWSTKIVLNYGNVVKAGSRSVAITHQAKWAGFRLHTDKPIATTGLGRVRFWLHGGTSGGQALTLYTENGKGGRSAIVSLAAPKAQTWTLVEVPLSKLGSPALIGDLVIQEAGGSYNRTFYVDQIEVAP